MRKLTLVLSTAALAMTGTAIAQTSPAAAPAKARAPMADMTRAQAQAHAEARFDRLDTDRNGSITRAEIDAMIAQRADKRREGKQRMGRTGDGKRAMMGAAAGPISRQAFVDQALTRFDRADANRDGTVTAAERKALRETMRAQRQQS